MRPSSLGPNSASFAMVLSTLDVYAPAGEEIEPRPFESISPDVSAGSGEGQGAGGRRPCRERSKEARRAWKLSST